MPDTTSAVPLVNDAATRSQYLDPSSIPWEKSKFPGITMKMLYNDPATGFSTWLFKLEPGARVPPHEHTGVEQTWVIEGRFCDHEGEAVSGGYISRPAGSKHSAYAPDGAVILSFFTGPNKFYEGHEWYTETLVKR
ncbi:MAG: hypothetical protein FJX53_10605 [Alphaproteobacteria bacterium]|nr:hypothetical protein [Alphaproteobacteria bacterium]